jgi:hypothetical protein
MARRGIFRNQRIDDKICVLLEQRMAKEHRKGSLNAYVEEILDKWVSGLITETAADPMKEHVFRTRNVRRVGPAKGVIEDDEGKRKAS